MKKRTSATELPDGEEFQSIFDKESQRAIPAQNIGKHFASLEVLNGVSHLPINQTFRDSDGFDEVAANGELFINDFLGQLETGAISRNTLDDIYDYLCALDEPEECDLIFVFGRHSDKARIIKGVELYHEGLAPIIVLAGGHPNYLPRARSEAEVMQEYALLNGVRSEAMILEKGSISIPGNVKAALDMFDELKLNWQSMTLVMSPFAMRRAMAFFSKFTVSKKFIRVGADTDGVRRDSWFKQEETVRYVMNEYVKLRIGIVSDTL